MLTSTVATILALGAAEIALRLVPGLASRRVENAVFSVYGDFPGGIFFRDRITDFDFMRPRFATSVYSGGYEWMHETDADGFRNPPSALGHEVLVLGDSMVYGHGLSSDETIVQRLRTDHGWRATNMARPGDCLFQHYVLLRLYLDRFQPRRVILFVFWNDFLDLAEARTAREIVEASEIDVYEYEALAERVLASEPRYSLWDQVFFRSRVLRLLGALSKGPPRTSVQSGPMQAGDFDRVARYYDRILADLSHRLRERGAELEIVLLDHPSLEWGELESRIHDLLESLSQEHGFDYRSTGPLLESCRGCLLPGDGHLSGEGARRVAAFLASPGAVGPS